MTGPFGHGGTALGRRPLLPTSSPVAIGGGLARLQAVSVGYPQEDDQPLNLDLLSEQATQLFPGRTKVRALRAPYLSSIRKNASIEVRL